MMSFIGQPESGRQEGHAFSSSIGRHDMFLLPFSPKAVARCETKRCLSQYNVSLGNFRIQNGRNSV
jgi:hypothetical protein